MKSSKIVLLVLAVLVLLFSNTVLAREIIWQEISRGHTSVRSVLVDPENHHTMYSGTDKGVFKTEDEGESWRPLLFVKGKNREVNFLLFDPFDKNSLYACTGNGLYVSSNSHATWTKAFKGKDYREQECTALLTVASTYFLGTRGGLFVSKDRAHRWQRVFGSIGSREILTITSHPKDLNCIFVACSDGVYITQDKGASWKRIFVTHSEEDINEAEEKPEDSSTEEAGLKVRYLSVDPNNPNCLYAATSRGVYRSQDKGASWDALFGFGLLSNDIKFLFVSSRSDVYALTDAAVFMYQDHGWLELSLGLMAEKMNALTMDKNEVLYVATDAGLFKATGKDFNSKENNILTSYRSNEPGIEQVQQAAIGYAEVELEKIKKWRRQASQKALLPEVSVGVNRDVTDLWHWEGGSTTKNGDDCLMRGHDAVAWDVSLRWDLGELIWNDDQTSIDVRSRLMVELRDDILDEVTKIYFERLRVKMDLDNLSIEEKTKRLEKELRLDELTAQLNALTGGYFSQALLKNKS